MNSVGFSRSRLGDFAVDSRVLSITAMAAVVGAISAFLAKGLLSLIALFTNLAWFQRLSVANSSPADHAAGLMTVAVPVIGGLLIGLLARDGSEKIRGHGIPEAIEAILIGRSRMSLKVAVLKPLSSALSIGTGGPFGAEGPIIMTGGAFGSLFAQRFHLTSVERKTLLVAGAAAGMAAVFATPLAAVLLAVELLLFEWRPRSFIPVAVAASVAGVLRMPLLGDGPMFPIAPHATLPGASIAFACAVGVVTGFGSGALTALVYGFEDLFQRLPIHWMWWPAIGGLVVGLGGLFEPRVLGVGYELIHGLLFGEIAGFALLGLLLAKALVWSVALGSGTSGGVLAPLLIMGGAMGALLGHWIPVGDPGLWALIGMASMMGGTMRAPFTGTVFALELTHDLNALPALLIGTVAAQGVTVLLLRRSILTEKVARRGHHIVREYAVDPLTLVRVKEVMDADLPTAPASMPAAELTDRIAGGDAVLARRQATLLVDDRQRLCGIVTRGDLVRAVERDASGNMTALEAGSQDLIVTYPEELLHDAVAKMLRHDIGRLPVVDPDDPSRLLGYLGRQNVIAARQRLHDEEHTRDGGLFSRPA